MGAARRDPRPRGGDAGRRSRRVSNRRVDGVVACRVVYILDGLRKTVEYRSLLHACSDSFVFQRERRKRSKRERAGWSRYRYRAQATRDQWRGVESTTKFSTTAWAALRREAEALQIAIQVPPHRERSRRGFDTSVGVGCSNCVRSARRFLRARRVCLCGAG